MISQQAFPSFLTREPPNSSWSIRRKSWENSPTLLPSKRRPHVVLHIWRTWHGSRAPWNEHMNLLDEEGPGKERSDNLSGNNSAASVRRRRRRWFQAEWGKSVVERVLFFEQGWTHLASKRSTSTANLVPRLWDTSQEASSKLPVEVSDLFWDFEVPDGLVATIWQLFHSYGQKKETSPPSGL